MLNARLVGPIVRRLLFVATHHVDRNATFLQGFHGFGCMGLQSFTCFQIKMVGFGEVDGLIGQGECACLVNHDGINLAHAL